MQASLSCGKVEHHTTANAIAGLKKPTFLENVSDKPRNQIFSNQLSSPDATGPAELLPNSPCLFYSFLSQLSRG